MRGRGLWCLLVVAAAGCGDAALDAELAQARSALQDALVTSRLEEMRVSAELYLQLPGNAPDLEGFIAEQHHSLEIGSTLRAQRDFEEIHQQVEEALETAQAEFVQAGGDPAAVAAPRRTAFSLGVEQARYWRRATKVAEQRSGALLDALRAVAGGDAPSQKQVAAVRTQLRSVRRVIEQAFGAADGDVGYATREQFTGLEARLDAALGAPGAIDPASDEPLPAALVPDVRAACDSAVGAVKFWRQFSLGSLAGTQRSERTSAATRQPFGWLEIAGKAAVQEPETAEQAAELLGLLSVLHGGSGADPQLEGLEGWSTEVVNRGLTPARIRALTARLRDWFGE